MRSLLIVATPPHSYGALNPSLLTFDIPKKHFFLTFRSAGPPRGDASENVSVVRSKLPGTLLLKNLGKIFSKVSSLLDLLGGKL